MTIRSGIISGNATERVIIGQRATDAISQEVDRLNARRVFILAGNSLRQKTDEIAAIEAALGERHAATFSGIRPHGPKSDIVAAANTAKTAKADLIVSIGGGTITDSGKILGLALRHDAMTVDALDALRIQYDNQGRIVSAPKAGPEIRTICVPTTLSGGEFNPLSGAFDEALGQKHGYSHPLMAPISIILDPWLSLHTPEWLWLSTGVRAVDHAVETLVSNHSNAYYDGLAESGLRLLARALPAIKANGTNVEARLDSQIGAWQSIIPLVSGIPMGASHAIGHALGAHCGTPHGYTSCVMAASVQHWNAALNLPAHHLIQSIFGQPDVSVARILDGFIAGLGLPSSLDDIGATPDQYDKLADLTLHDLWGGTNVRPLGGAADVIDILRLAQHRKKSF